MTYIKTLILSVSVLFVGGYSTVSEPNAQNNEQSSSQYQKNGPKSR